MGLFDEAAMYWTRIVAVASVGISRLHALWCGTDADVWLQEHELPIQEYSHIYFQLAAYEMGEHHVTQSRPRVIGELSLAEVYLSKVINLNNEVSVGSRKLLESIHY